jgi:hypothetical protein
MVDGRRTSLHHAGKRFGQSGAAEHVPIALNITVFAVRAEVRRRV